MQVRFQGFTLSVQGAITLDQVLSRFGSTISRAAFKEAGRVVLVDTNVDPHYHLGLVITVKDQRKFCELREANKSFTVQVHKVNAAARLMDFNFFVVNKKTGAGLYQHYHQSCSPMQCLKLITKQFRLIREELADQQVDHALDDHARKRALRRARSTYRDCKIAVAMMVRKENLATILATFRKIKSFDFDIAFNEADAATFNPVAKHVRKQRRHFTFIQGSSVLELAAAIGKTVSDHAIGAGYAQGVDDEGMDRVVRVMNNLDNYAEYDYDDVAPLIDGLDVERFVESKILDQLLDVCRKNKAVFEGLP